MSRGACLRHAPDVAHVDSMPDLEADPGLRRPGPAAPRWGERPLLILVAKPGVDLVENDILAFLAERLAKWWLPDRILMVGELPRTGTGKLMKAELRKRYPSLDAAVGPAVEGTPGDSSTKRQE
jgi:acyl-CoA synthetase (AMP-forming)/AMP-acid ligase II